MENRYLCLSGNIIGSYLQRPGAQMHAHKAGSVLRTTLFAFRAAGQAHSATAARRGTESISRRV